MEVRSTAKWPLRCRRVETAVLRMHLMWPLRLQVTRMRLLLLTNKALLSWMYKMWMRSHQVFNFTLQIVKSCVTQCSSPVVSIICSPDNIADHFLVDNQYCCLDNNYYYFDRIEAIGSSIDHRHSKFRLPGGFVVGKDRQHRCRRPMHDVALTFLVESIDVSVDY